MVVPRKTGDTLFLAGITGICLVCIIAINDLKNTFQQMPVA